MKTAGVLFLLFLANFILVSGQEPSADNAKRNVKVFNIKDYGAVGDGLVLNTESINKTINACAETGGGTVLVPAGRFLTGTVQLKSNITLFLDKDATIMATDDLSQFKGANVKEEDPDRPINITHKTITQWTRALILLEKVENVTITGAGTIDGMLIPKPSRAIHGIMATESKNISISEIRVTRAGDWSIVGLYVDGFKISNLTVADGYDGIHVRRGKNILIENCKLYSRDDAIAGGYWENALISNCTLNSSCNGIRIILPVTDLEIKECDIIGPGVFGHYRGSPDNPWITKLLTGIIFQPGAWGIGKGKSDNIYIHNIKIKDALTALTFVLNEGNTADRIRIENIIATGITNNACSVEAWPEGSTYENVKFKNVSVAYNITNPAFMNVKNFTRPRTESRPLPYWGFYVKNVKNIEFENVTLDYAGTAENRPLMGFDGVGNVLLKNVKYRNVNGVQPFIYPAGTKVKFIKTAPLK
jgi:polygalacturonase